ncbi:MAG: competence/damage-inducible protein A [Bacteroidales bacterium]|nr:competence/damage-inducible protein A [Bacteroidales bacterium]
MSKKIQAELISIGDELLIGQVINTNSSWIAEKLNASGIKVYQAISISDNKEHILQTLEECGSRSDIIIITGGLGPTKDDITKETLCEFFNSKLIFNQKAYENVEEIFRVRGFKVSEINRRQAEIPECCIPIFNKNGTAPGMWFENNGKIFVSMPGVPFEMKSMLEDFVIPKLLVHFKTNAIIHKTILTQGGGESHLAEIIADWEDSLSENMKLAYLPQPGIVRLRISANGENEGELKKEIELKIKELQKIIPDKIFGFDNDTLEEIIGNLLIKAGKSLSTAESCTGGAIAKMITSISGSSNYYMGSVVAYSNDIKEKILGVKHQTLIDNGAVSEDVVKEMAIGVKNKFNTDFAIATSGIAGPGGAVEGKPVGTTWIAIASPNDCVAKKLLLGDHRGRNIQKASLTALNMLRKTLILLYS